jgi:hypothetical protein
MGANSAGSSRSSGKGAKKSTKAGNVKRKAADGKGAGATYKMFQKQARKRK